MDRNRDFAVFHTPRWLVALARDSFEAQGYWVSENTRFSGTLIPMGFYQRDERVMGIMIELNRALYIEESRGGQNNAYPQTSEVLGRCLDALLDGVEKTMQETP